MRVEHKDLVLRCWVALQAEYAACLRRPTTPAELDRFQNGALARQVNQFWGAGTAARIAHEFQGR